jgi:hypothetical protein
MMKKQFAAATGLAAAFVFLLGSAANAAVDPSLGPAVTTGFSDTTSFASTILVPALIAITVFGLVVALAIKYLRRGVSKA